MKPFDWVPLLDETQEPEPVSVDMVGKCATADELRMCYLKVQEMPLSSVERAALDAAINARANALNISSWDFKPYDEGTMMHAAMAMQDAVVSGPALVAILDDAPGKPLRFRFKGSEAAVVSLNERVYLPEILTDAAQRVASRARAKAASWGEDEHPPMDVTDGAGRKRFRRTRSKAVLIPENVTMDRNVVLVDARVLEDTEPGRALAADIRAGRPVFFSTRAYGADLRVVTLTDGRQVKVPMQMEIETWDRVRNPAFPDARPLAVLDSVQVQAICDSVQGKVPGPNTPRKEECSVKWTKTMVEALGRTPEGRRELAAALTDSTLEPEIRNAMTDALAAPAAAPAAQPIDVQATVTQAVTDALARQAEAQRQADESRATKKAEAGAYVTGEIQKLRDGNKYPAAMLDSIATELANCPDKQVAEVMLRQQVRMADSVLAGAGLAGLGYVSGASGLPTLQHAQIRENAPWKPIVDGLVAAFDDWRFRATGERHDPEVRKANKPFVDKMMAKFDTLNARALVDCASGWNTLTDSISTSDLYTQPIIQRAILEQAFGDADMLQFLFTDTFEGDQMRVPVEYFSAPTSVELNTAEEGSIAEGEIKTSWLLFSPVPRRVRIEITNDVQKGMASGPLRYDAAARALYHISALIRRTINRAAGNEMLRASDAYGAVAVTNEEVAVDECSAVSDAGNTAFKIVLRRGGSTGALTATNTDRPIVRPRKYKSISEAGVVSDTAENTITVTLDDSDLTEGFLYTDDSGINYVKDASGANLSNGFAVDYENGYVYISDGSVMSIGATPVLPTIDYYYATNFTTFSLTPDSGYKADEWYTKLLQTIGLAAALMGKSPRYMAPNFALGSLTAMEYVAQAHIFYQLNSPKGTILNPGTQNYIASRNGMDYARHNTQWQAGDSRILLGRVGATKYGVRDPLRPEGPFPSYDASRKVIAAKQWFAEEWSALVTPEVRNQSGTTLNPYYRTIKLKS